MEHNDHIERLRTTLEQHLKWGPVSEWHSSMFTELSKLIFDSCQIMLSTATLKRFFGIIQHEGNPSISTLDTLSLFVGFENWRAFKLAQPVKQQPLHSAFPRKSLYVTIGFFLAIFTIMLIAYTPKNIEVPDNITFSSRPVAESYPNSVVFDFDLKGIRSDSLHIQQYWDPTKTLRIRYDQHQATGIYYFPGYFRARLNVDGKSVREHDLFLKSNGWMGTVDYNPVPNYFSLPTSNKSVLKYPESLVQEVTESEEPVYITYHYINDLGDVSGDTFDFTARIRSNWNQRWAVCQTSSIYIIGTEGAMIIPVTKNGCSSDISLMLNDVYLKGKEHDLSAFGINFLEYTNLQLIVRDKKVNIQINGEEVYRGQYQQEMGKFVGVRFKFLGLGEIAEMRLQDQNGIDVVLR